MTQNQKNHKNLDFHQREQKVDFTWFDSILLDFTQIRSNTSFPLMISIINSPCLYGKPPSLLRDSGSKNPIFSSKSAFLKKEKTWSHIISKILRCALFLSNQRFWGKKISKKISTSPSLIFAKNGRPEPLRDSGSKNLIFSSKSAFLKKEKTWSHMISEILRCALFLSNQRFWGKFFSKQISTSPSLKFAKNGWPEPL